MSMKLRRAPRREGKLFSFLQGQLVVWKWSGRHKEKAQRQWNLKEHGALTEINKTLHYMSLLVTRQRWVTPSPYSKKSGFSHAVFAVK